MSGTIKPFIYFAKSQKRNPMKPLPLIRAPLMALSLFVLASAGCHAQNPPESAADKAFGAKVRAYLLAHPEVIQEAVDKLQANETAAKEAGARAAVVAHRAALEHDARDGVIGSPTGKITVVEFFDYRCPYCKAAAPELQKLLAANPDVRLVLKEFPILDVEDQSHISEDAARGALAALPQGHYAAVHNALLAAPHLDEAAIGDILKRNGVDLTKDQALATTKPITDHLAENHTLARDLGVDGTPAFVVGDTVISGARLDDLQAAITAARGEK
jgi:protein-disulfide isomerase